MILLPGLAAMGYVTWRGAQALFTRRWQRVSAVSVALLIFFLGRFLPGGTGAVLDIASAGCMVMLPCLLLVVLFFDALRFAHRCRPFFPAWVTQHYVCTKRLVLGLTLGAVAALLLHGYGNYAHPVTTPAVVRLEKSGGSRNAVRIAIASDIHLGTLNGKKRLAENVAQINAIGADLILLPGDIVDRSLRPLIEQDMAAELSRLRAPLGVYAVLGNHEVFAESQACADYLERCGIRVLRDEAVLVGGDFYLVGRKDRRERPARKSLEEVMRGVDRSKPVLLMDHQPVALAEGAAQGVDLQLSGHTHNGQVWPMNWIVYFLYEVAHGHGRHGAMQIYVTSGLGLWGFPARIGSVSEVVDMRVEFAAPRTDGTDEKSRP
ncbi:MAG: metallophosphoesterase [Puniceicoccales bacterium]|nr:metallophosphoesterase [Puniceicoccales bacterium]